MKKPSIGRDILIAGAALAMAGCATLKEELETRFGGEVQDAKEKIKKAGEIVKKKVNETIEEVEDGIREKDQANQLER